MVLSDAWYVPDSIKKGSSEMTTKFEEKLESVLLKMAESECCGGDYCSMGKDTKHSDDSDVKPTATAIKALIKESMPEEPLIEDGDNEETKFGVKCVQTYRSQTLENLGIEP